MEEVKLYNLNDSNGKLYKSNIPGLFGGHKKLKIYGKLNCPSALRHIEKSHYVKYRVFFADEETAIAAGYRPCGICMKEAYKRWKGRSLKDMPNKSLKIIGTAGILIGVAYVIGKNVWEDKNAPIAVFKYTAETDKIERLK